MTGHSYKLLVVDIDGTLVDRQGNISKEDRQALAEARRRGIQVSLSTGRSLMACRSTIERLSLDGYHISFDGALVSSPTTGEEAYAMPLDRALVGQMIDFSHQNGIDLELFSTTHYFSERETWSTEAHRRFFDVEATMADFSQLWQRERIIKGGLVTTKPEDEAWVESFRRHFDGRLHLSRAKTPAYPDVTFINVLNPQVSKGNALKALAGYLGIAPAEVMAAGDGTNDISLLSAAGLAVAMGNAPAEVKAAADYVTLDVDHSGLAAAVRKFLLRPPNS